MESIIDQRRCAPWALYKHKAVEFFNNQIAEMSAQYLRNIFKIK